MVAKDKKTLVELQCRKIQMPIIKMIYEVALRFSRLTQCGKGLSKNRCVSSQFTFSHLEPSHISSNINYWDKFMSEESEVNTKLDLARDYIVSGDEFATENILAEVMEDGGVEQKKEAKVLLDKSREQALKLGYVKYLKWCEDKKLKPKSEKDYIIDQLD